MLVKSLPSAHCKWQPASGVPAQFLGAVTIHITEGSNKASPIKIRKIIHRE